MATPTPAFAYASARRESPRLVSTALSSPALQQALTHAGVRGSNASSAMQPPPAAAVPMVASVGAVSAFAPSSHSGWLLKQGGNKGGRKSWKRRWFRLKEDCLYYYKDEKARNEIGIMPLHGCRVLDLPYESPPLWEANETCFVCLRPFSLLLRQHHCRGCGRSLCDACSARSIPLPQFGMNQAVRVCQACCDATAARLKKWHVRLSADDLLLSGGAGLPSLPALGAGGGSSNASPDRTPRSDSLSDASGTGDATADGDAGDDAAILDMTPPGSPRPGPAPLSGLPPPLDASGAESLSDVRQIVSPSILESEPRHRGVAVSSDRASKPLAPVDASSDSKLPAATKRDSAHSTPPSYSEWSVCDEYAFYFSLPRSNRRNLFAVRTLDRELWLQAESPADRAAWIAVLRDVEARQAAILRQRRVMHTQLLQLHGSGSEGGDLLSVTVRQWSTEDVSAWLHRLRLDQYIDLFRDNRVDGELLLSLTDEDLQRAVGINNRLHRRKILQKRPLDDAYTQTMIRRKTKTKTIHLHLNTEAISSGAAAIALAEAQAAEVTTAAAGAGAGAGAAASDGGSGPSRGSDATGPAVQQVVTFRTYSISPFTSPGSSSPSPRSAGGGHHRTSEGVRRSRSDRHPGGGGGGGGGDRGSEDPVSPDPYRGMHPVSKPLSPRARPQSPSSDSTTTLTARYAPEHKLPTTTTAAAAAPLPHTPLATQRQSSGHNLVANRSFSSGDQGGYGTAVFHGVVDTAAAPPELLTVDGGAEDPAAAAAGVAVAAERDRERSALRKSMSQERMEMLSHFENQLQSQLKHLGASAGGTAAAGEAHLPLTPSGRLHPMPPLAARRPASGSISGGSPVASGKKSAAQQPQQPLNPAHGAVPTHPSAPGTAINTAGMPPMGRQLTPLEEVPSGSASSDSTSHPLNTAPAMHGDAGTALANTFTIPGSSAASTSVNHATEAAAAAAAAGNPSLHATSASNHKDHASSSLPSNHPDADLHVVTIAETPPRGIVAAARARFERSPAADSTAPIHPTHQSQKSGSTFIFKGGHASQPSQSSLLSSSGDTVVVARRAHHFNSSGDTSTYSMANKTLRSNRGGADGEEEALSPLQRPAGDRPSVSPGEMSMSGDWTHERALSSGAAATLSSSGSPVFAEGDEVAYFDENDQSHHIGLIVGPALAPTLPRPSPVLPPVKKFPPVRTPGQLHSSLNNSKPQVSPRPMAAAAAVAAVAAVAAPPPPASVLAAQWYEVMVSPNGATRLFPADQLLHFRRAKVEWHKGRLIGKGAYGRVYEGLSKSDGRMIAIKEMRLNAVQLSEQSLATAENPEEPAGGGAAVVAGATENKDNNNNSGNNKLMPTTAELRREVGELAPEISLMQMLQHPNVVKFLGTEIDRNRGKLYIFMERVSGGSIKNMLELYGPLPERVVASYTTQVLHGLSYLHRNGIVHRDLKCSNVLVTTEGVVKLADFGVAKRLREVWSITTTTVKRSPPTDTEAGADRTHQARKNTRRRRKIPTNLQTMVGSPFWMAPEVVTQAGYGRRADIWSLGCTVIEMCTAKVPWSEYNQLAAVFAIGQTDKLPTLPANVSDLCTDFIMYCLQRDKEARPTADELLHHPWLQMHSPSPSISSQSGPSPLVKAVSLSSVRPPTHGDAAKATTVLAKAHSVAALNRTPSPAPPAARHASRQELITLPNTTSPTEPPGGHRAGYFQLIQH